MEVLKASVIEMDDELRRHVPNHAKGKNWCFAVHDKDDEISEVIYFYTYKDVIDNVNKFSERVLRGETTLEVADTALNIGYNFCTEKGRKEVEDALNLEGDKTKVTFQGGINEDDKLEIKEIPYKDFDNLTDE